MDDWYFFSFAEITSVTASLLGAVATIFFAVRAKSAAERAQDAAISARSQYAGINVMAEINMATTLLNDLGSRIANDSWELAEERSTSLRNRIAPIVQQNGELFSESTRSALVTFSAQMRAIGEASDKARFTSANGPSKQRLLGIVREQKKRFRLQQLK